MNPLVDIVKFFSDYVAQDLQAASGSVHPVLEVDSIRFLYTFRSQVCTYTCNIDKKLTPNQLTKDQLLSVLPLLVQHLASPNYVAYTYSAIAIERILFMKQPNTTRPLCVRHMTRSPMTNNI